MDGSFSEPAAEHPAEHPKGTLAILILYALAFAGGFLALYFLEFLKRGAPHP